jgi:protein MpaA
MSDERDGHPPKHVRTLAFVASVVAAFGLAAPASARTVLLGHSWHGRPIEAVEVGNRSGPPVLVIGCIHGNETGGIAIARALERLSPRDLDLWIVPDLNPDGFAAGTRQNGHGVDLNRNFPWRWARHGTRGDQHYSGPSPLSEPESRALAALILRVRPQATVWFHQHLAVVDESGGSVAVEQRFASAVGLPLRRLERYRGSAASWQNHRLPETTSFVVELPAGSLTARQAQRYAEAVAALAG